MAPSGTKKTGQKADVRPHVLNLSQRPHELNFSSTFISGTDKHEFWHKAMSNSCSHPNYAVSSIYSSYPFEGCINHINLFVKRYDRIIRLIYLNMQRDGKG